MARYDSSSDGISGENLGREIFADKDTRMSALDNGSKICAELQCQ
jgi:hypothetical protein